MVKVFKIVLLLILLSTLLLLGVFFLVDQERSEFISDDVWRSEVTEWFIANRSVIDSASPRDLGVYDMRNSSLREDLEELLGESVFNILIYRVNGDLCAVKVLSTNRLDFVYFYENFDLSLIQLSPYEKVSYENFPFFQLHLTK
ncbi:hypothetical protein ACFPK9_05560 [Rubritalea spongiae]|uniref:hypothetical protein n=1 Tax=Rubritalea spongiae TaxID=430797 RepID=UPI003610DDAE